MILALLQQTPPVTSTPADPFAAIFGLFATNPIASVVAGLAFAVWWIGKNAPPPKKPEELSEEELESALVKVRERKAKTSSPDMKQLLERIDKLTTVIEGQSTKKE